MGAAVGGCALGGLLEVPRDRVRARGGSAGRSAWHYIAMHTP